MGKTTNAMSANPWMRGGRFWINGENLCVTSTSSTASEITTVGSFRSQLNPVMIRIVADPSSTWDIQNANSITYMDSAVAQLVAVGNAAGTTSYNFDAENYSTSTLFNSYSSLYNNPATPLSRADMCAKVQAFGAAFGNSLWSRVPTASIYLFFGPSYLMSMGPSNGTAGTGVPTSMPDSSYSGNSYYNMYPYFCLGLLSACPTTGRIIDYMEGSYYSFAGLWSIQKEMYASNNWVSIFFPAETALITKAATCWVAVPMIYANPYFSGTTTDPYPGAHLINATDQQNYFTRNLVYCLQQCPSGYIPGIYIEGCDPWGLSGTVSNPTATIETCLANAVAVYQGTITLASLMNLTALSATLNTAFSGNSTWRTERA